MNPPVSEVAWVVQSTSEHATEQFGECLGQLLRPGDVLLLSGDLGAGKTHLAKGIAHGLGVAEEITSPTFNLVLVHEGRMPLYHVDLYRLDSADQLEEIGYFDAIEGGGAAVVEWGDRFQEAVPADAIGARLEIEGDETRAIRVSGEGSRGSELAAQWVARAEDVDGLTVKAAS